MVPAEGRRSTAVARVDPDLCVSCGICAGSCAPMGVGPAGRTGRDQLAAVQVFLAAPERHRGEIVAIACEHGAAACRTSLMGAGATVYGVSCAGNLHTSVIELMIRGGAGGVLVLACPPRDCWNREGPRWLTERVYHEREAELQARVSRDRVRIAYAAAREATIAVTAVREFSRSVAALDPPDIERHVQPETVCEPEVPA
jgi:coenzyme F420-reducing hydrogenase delta subunit